MAILGKYKKSKRNSISGATSGGQNQGHGSSQSQGLANSAKELDKHTFETPLKQQQYRGPSTSSTVDSTITTDNTPIALESPATTDHSVVIIDDSSSVDMAPTTYTSNKPRQVSISSRSTTKSTGTTNNLEPRSPTDSMAAKRTSVYSVTSLSEYDRAQLLRDEINRESLSLQRLEKLYEDLPKFSSNGYHHNQHQAASANNYHYDYYEEDVQSTSRVIERLQKGMDGLRRELKEQKEIAKEELANREALKKRTEILESTIEVVKHQNDMLNRILDRKERRITELESEMESKNKQLDNLSKAAQSNATAQQQYESRIAQCHEDKYRAEAAYKAVLDSCRKMKAKYHDDIVVIGDKITQIQADREDDASKLEKLHSQLKDQAKEKDNLMHLQQKQSDLRKRHMKQLESMFTDMKQVIAESDKTMTQRVKNTLRVINQLEQQYIELGGDKRNLEYSDQFRVLN